MDPIRFVRRSVLGIQIFFQQAKQNKSLRSYPNANDTAFLKYPSVLTELVMNREPNQGLHL